MAVTAATARPTPASDVVPADPSEGGWSRRVRRSYRRRSPGEPRAVGYLYILPAVVVFVALVVVPFGQSVWYSFYNWDGLSPAVWVGLGNYRSLVTDPTLRAPFLHAMVLLVFYSLLPIAIGLLLAAALTRVRVRGLTFFRVVLFLPQVLAMVVVALAFDFIYAPEGLLNTVLGDVGLGGLSRAWLGDFHLALPAVGLAGTWVGFGLCMVLFLAGVQSIPRDLYEAARLDGAGAWTEFRWITLPELRPQIAVAATLTIVAGLRNFDLIYLTTSGGPGNTTAVPAYEVYHRAFETSQVGYGAAVGITLTLLVFFLTLTVSRLLEGRR